MVVDDDETVLNSVVVLENANFRVLSADGEASTVKVVITQMNQTGGVQAILEREEAELIRTLRQRDGMAIESSADQMDEIQYAAQRDLAIGNVDRESALLRDVKAALRRLRDGSFGVCFECESPISPKRCWHCIALGTALYPVPGGRGSGGTDRGETRR